MTGHDLDEDGHVARYCLCEECKKLEHPYWTHEQMASGEAEKAVA